MSRNNEDQSQWLRVDHLAAPDTTTAGSDSTRRSVHDFENDMNVQQHQDGGSVQYQTKLFLQQLRGYLAKQTLDRRGLGGISFDARKGHKTSQLLKVQARAHIMSLFAQYLPSPEVV